MECAGRADLRKFHRTSLDARGLRGSTGVRFW